jgi:hypothetical protein
MGALSILFRVGVAALTSIWYVYYANTRIERHGAIFHWFALLGRLQSVELESEFRQIMVEKGARPNEPFDDVVLRAMYIDADDTASYHGLIQKASEKLSQRLPRTADFIAEKFVESGLFGIAPMSHGVALLHFRMPDLEASELVLMRSRGWRAAGAERAGEKGRGRTAARGVSADESRERSGRPPAHPRAPGGTHREERLPQELDGRA